MKMKGLGALLTWVAAAVGLQAAMRAKTQEYAAHQATGTYASIKHHSQLKQRLICRRRNQY